MRWLEPPGDAGERLLREALDQATQRTGDEITHRRVWTKIAEDMEKPRRRIAGRMLFAIAAIVLVGVAGMLGLPPALDWIATQTPARPRTSPPGLKVVPPTPPIIEPERTPGQHVSTQAGEHARVALGGGAEAELAENSSLTWDKQLRPSIEGGTARLVVPHQPPGWRFSVTAGPYVVTVVGTKFDVRVDSRTVGVEVSEGVVEVWHGSHSTRLAAGDSWQGPNRAEDKEVEASAPAEKPAPSPRLALRHPIKGATMLGRGMQQAQAALQAGDTSKALETLDRIAAGTGPAAENAAYEIGRITRYTLNRPRQAISLWDKYRTRFPSGLLRTETDLSIVDTLSSLGDAHAALLEAEAFLARHPTSERRAEVQKLAERLRAAESAAGSR
jgi:hypothetical protein